MRGTTRWVRGAVTLAALAAVTTALLAAPGGAAGVLTKAKVKKIATKVFNSKIGSASVGAVNGVSINRFFFQADPNTTDAVIGTFGPMTLKATCNGAGTPTLRATWSESVNYLNWDGDSGVTGSFAVPANETANLGSGAFGTVGLAEAVGTTSQFHTSVEYFLRDTPGLGDNRCFYSGYVAVA